MSQQTHQGPGHNIITQFGDVNIIEPLKMLSLLSEIVNTLGKIVHQEEENENLTAFNITAKIEFNNVIKHRGVFNERKLLVGRLSNIYEVLDSEGSNKSLTILAYIKGEYLKAKGDFLLQYQGKEELEIVQENADAIISTVEKKLLSKIQQSSNLSETVEMVELCLSIIIIDAFMRCKILEEPI